jgi:Protein of unknown function (DUF4231)
MTQSDWTPETFLAERVSQYQDWYDRKAVTAKSRYLQMRGFSVVAGGVVPVLINTPAEADHLLGFPVVRLIVTVISLLVVISVSLESVLHYREQWKNYRSTEQLLGHETIAFKAGVGVYRGLSPQEAFSLFVERVEEAIRSENAATLNVMTMANEPAPDDERARRVVQKS